ncbi:MAG TPA: DNA repair protein RecN, partial [Candidatus Polarisedimenticolia bacterium]|nr:DNA repair protein RecN [Candidatus Polarisedimenticolia bacterium]
LAAAEAAASLSRYLGGEEFDPGRLEAVASRLAALDRLRRRYGRSIEELIALRDASRAELEDLAEAPARLESLARELDRAEEAYRTAAEALSSARKKAAARLSRAVQSELRALAMGGTRVEIAVDPLPGGSGGALGADAVAFLIAPNQGEGLRPLSRIASGGELSRLMLAVRNASSASSDARTLVFDEVDTGVGGTVAESVGQRLAALGGSQQVVCVTHLAPIAAAADRHLRVAKEASGGRTRVAVTSLDRQGRIDELARMLGGGLTATARRHAEAMVGRRGGAATA